MEYNPKGWTRMYTLLHEKRKAQSQYVSVGRAWRPSQVRPSLEAYGGAGLFFCTLLVL